MLRKELIWIGFLYDRCQERIDHENGGVADGTPASVRNREQLIYTADLSQLSANLNNLGAQRARQQATIDRLGATRRDPGTRCRSVGIRSRQGTARHHSDDECAARPESGFPTTIKLDSDTKNVEGAMAATVEIKTSNRRLN
jgi:hypothetical protein